MAEYTNMDLCPLPLPPRSQSIPNPARVSILKSTASVEKQNSIYAGTNHSARKLQVINSNLPRS